MCLMEVKGHLRSLQVKLKTLPKQYLKVGSVDSVHSYMHLHCISRERMLLCFGEVKGHLR